MISMSLLKRKNFWKDREDRILAVLLEALVLLANKNPLFDHEDRISRELFLFIREVNARHIENGKGVEPGPFFQAHNQPYADDTTFDSRENNKPDIQWGLFNPTEPDYRKRDCYFTIECKRLGSPTRRAPGRKFNKEYVTAGLVRFIEQKEGYAKGEESALMIGYVQDMDFDDILKEVNNEITNITITSVPNLTIPSSGWRNKDVSKLNHNFVRPVSLPFELIHLWVDLKGICIETPTKPRKSHHNAKKTGKKSSAKPQVITETLRTEIEIDRTPASEYSQTYFDVE